ncbi:putative transporter C83.11 [Colletotrichum liriopes]|uniref:Transporter C83.11 n=1 Tax=Colletotrichum liriopes TaxID=708192 RepID=A0AA37GL08_9PEZI|nr:putative transporter C83.11 [Colletotrichum liriopes]
MPHSTTSGSTIQTSSVNRSQHSPRSHGDSITLSANGGMEKFPDHIDSHLTNGSRARALQRRTAMRFQARLPVGRGVKWGPGGQPSATRYGHGRQKSLGDAIHNIRTRGGSVGQNAHEIADALRAPVSPKLIGLCVLWYASSALTNTSSKSILTAFDKPATLTLIQFAFVATYCILFAWLANVFPSLRTTIPALKHGIRYPSRDVIKTTMPLAAFQIFGHLLSSTATSKIPVSLVHTIKGLSPLFTVLAYRLIFNIRYSVNTYLSLVPLTLGVMLACSGKHNKYSGELLGILYALLATIIFVTQNIFSKRLFNEAAKAEAEGQSARSQKLDKLNLLCYSSGMAFILTVPIWFWSEGTGIIGDVLHDGVVDLNNKAGSFDHGRLTIEFIFNGTFHFGQNILAFVLLSLVSPVTYSVASLIKRVFVIVIAIIWFRNQTTPLQGVGILLTFVGLYLYDRTHDRDKADRKAKMMEIKEEPLLPLNTKDALNASQNAPVFESPMVSAGPFQSFSNGPSPRRSEDAKKSDGPSNGRARGASNAAWLAPGTKQEDTWRFGDR